MGAVGSRRVRFDGEIFGVGTSSGVRVVLGAWAASPFGQVVDVMVEDAAGHRTLIAPSRDIADFISATYTFDEVRVEATVVHATAGRVLLRSPSLDLDIGIGERTAIGSILRLVPGPLRRARWWCRALAVPARLLRPGLRTVGTAGAGRREYYCAADEHRITSARGTWNGVDLGTLRPVEPPVRFGFTSTPATPSRVRITTLIDLGTHPQ